MNIEEAKDNLNKIGYLDIDIDPRLDLFEEIKKLKKQKNAIILAHYYQEPDIQDIADYIGDSLGLAKEASTTDADMIAFAGVHFMAEIAKILSPDKKVVLPDLNAGCSLADSAPEKEFEEFKNKYPDHLVVSYVNCSAGVKALSDIICTSGNAKQIIESIPEDQPILFAPDKNLGAYLNKKTGRKMLLWNGSCIVHETFSLKKIIQVKSQFPTAKLIAHPECEEAVLNEADFIGSTTQLIKYVKSTDFNTFIIATENGVIHQMQKECPDKSFIPAPPDSNCACNNCPHMKLNSLEKLYLCLKYELPEITIPEDIRLRAKKPIDRMFEISQKAGLFSK